jgi:DNA polymerase IIIc chi subunit
MKRIRFAEKNWRPDDRTLISTGDYRIPEDMAPELAERAIAEGAAVVVVEDDERAAQAVAPPQSGRKRSP